MGTPGHHAGRFTQFIAQVFNCLAGRLDRIKPVQGREAERESERPEVITPGGFILFYQVKARQADQVAMRFGSRHAGHRSQITQHHRPFGHDQRLQ